MFKPAVSMDYQSMLIDLIALRNVDRSVLISGRSSKNG